ncbi:MAG: four helix bundle protein [Bacteroidetes bacterium]|nr:four helix bundle protein [Bacteroidota bacterium]
MTKEERKFDIEDRLIDFTVMIADVVETLPNTKAANHIGGQMIRSGSSPSLNYGEAQEAESMKDFIHKMGICRKELRETKVALKIIIRKSYKEVLSNSEKALKECLELLAIFSKSIETAKKNLVQK